MKQELDYYIILNVSEEDTLDDIKKAYKKLAKIKHPDKGGSNEEFAQLNNAYNWLLENHEKPKFEYSKRSDKIDLKERNIPFYWNLFDVFNGIKRSFTAKFDERFITIVVSEPPRCINYFEKPKLIETEATDYIVTVTHTIMTTSNAMFKLERNGYDLILTVLQKSDYDYLATPLDGIKVDNKVFDLVTFDNLGLYELTEDGAKSGNLIIDNSINRRKIETEIVETNGFDFRIGVILIAGAFVAWLLQLIM